jgi:hypothetical protein
MASSTGGKGTKKFGRGMRSPSHARYMATNRKKLNKICRLRRHLRALARKLMRRAIGEDRTAKVALEKLNKRY